MFDGFLLHIRDFLREREREIERIYAVCFGFYLNNTTISIHQPYSFSGEYCSTLGDQNKKLSFPNRSTHPLWHYWSFTLPYNFFWTFATFRLTITSIPCLYIYDRLCCYALFIWTTYLCFDILEYIHYIMYQKGLLYPKCNVRNKNRSALVFWFGQSVCKQFFFLCGCGG